MTTMAKPTIDNVRERARGQVITPTDDGYEGARKVYNGMIDRRPSVVIRAVDVGDVMAGVDYARENGLDLSVRGGSHSVPGFGTCDGGVVIDLSQMKGVRVDPNRKTARAGGGTLWADFNHATYPFGLATTGGIIGSTGIAGLTLGGGIGYLTRGFGLSLDNLLSADVVTADGQFRVASAAENEDLFWAIRGGGGNFGVVTSFEYQLHPVKDITAGIFFYPIEKVREVLRFYRDYVAKAPEEMGLFPAFQIAPPLPFIKAEDHGKTFIAIVSCWAGPMDKADAEMAKIRGAAPVVAEMVAPMPYYVINGLFDALLPPGLQHYWKASFATELTDGAIEEHAQFGPQVPVVNSTMHIYPINGACHRVKSDATAWGHRDASFATVIAGMWPDAADNAKNTKWVKDYYKALEPHSQAGGYINFMAEDDQGRVRDNFGPHYDKLASIKRKYDPGNLFHMNQNIQP
ncbi:FAD-binding oxidoreductase [Variovorax ureilyticus]|uniref:FAD-binding oxidoreductase n=1 Tax=Variovorax ureilyticus TaxID=1836198 RepID=A0ABU8VLP5_9BURK